MSCKILNTSHAYRRE
uniref:Uncharacterized protein n=1 Tax=Anguilla anguilla TaxID=7936 RepID=A0A0E9PIQ6_ANGAN